ncbi:type II toxin-antitoxin system HicB family antitoxin [Clostridium tertium]|jgi:predicted RNase H-like HicB family nuclease|uniref:type II toxin-antitoxin system HicB family antitoxin n=1 Tax=Clostridium tertium TaxID=1559 RepID=UPI000BE272B2|nr:type II toxin-antitoxin system HicB family antitoxin [Clostridium tertium]
MDKYVFFAVFTPGEEGGHTITFPDLPGCITEGDDIEEEMRNAKEALGLHLFGMEEDKEEIPNPSKGENIELEKGQFLVPIVVYMKNIRKDLDNKAVSKTITIPRWLKREAESQKINFSGVLQRALKKELGIEE